MVKMTMEVDVQGPVEKLSQKEKSWVMGLTNPRAIGSTWSHRVPNSIERKRYRSPLFKGVVERLWARIMSQL